MPKSSPIQPADNPSGLPAPRPMRRGSLSPRFVKCSKPNCACADDPKARHGPYWSLTRSVGGRTRSRFLTPSQAVIARRQIEEGQRFRDLIEHQWEVCEKMADQELSAGTETAEAVEKGGSKRASKPRSSMRSIA